MLYSISIFALSLTIVASGANASCSERAGKDIKENDIGNEGGKRRDECCGLCKNRAGCKAFAWSDYNGGTCWFKGATSPIKDKPGVYVGIVNGSPSGGSCTKQWNKDIDGGAGLAPVHGRAESQCCAECKSKPGCKAYSHNSYSGGTCWLKSSTGPVINKPGVSIGVVGSGPTPEPGPVPIKYHGDATSYGNDPTGGNCGFETHLPSTVLNDKYFVAISGQIWDGAMECGRCIEATCTGDKCHQKGKSVVVMVTDKCPECQSGSLDFSDKAFLELTGRTPNRVKIRWDWIRCPSSFVAGNIKYFLKGGSNPWWFALQPVNSIKRVQSMQMKTNSGKIIELTPPNKNHIDSYYFLGQDSGGMHEGFTLRTTASDGQVISDNFSGLWPAGQLQQGQHQFS